jgi:hypothetical protein
VTGSPGEIVRLEAKTALLSMASTCLLLQPSTPGRALASGLALLDYGPFTLAFQRARFRFPDRNRPAARGANRVEQLLLDGVSKNIKPSTDRRCGFAAPMGSLDERVEIMKATLIIPSPTTFTRKYKLAWRRTSNGQSSGLSVARSRFCRVLNGERFQDLRDVVGARIETDDVARIARALRLGTDEPGLIQIERGSKKCP